MIGRAKTAAAAAWTWLLALSADRGAPVVLFAAAVVVWSAQSLAWPFGPGRDFGTYIWGYVELLQAETIYPFMALQRPFVATIVTGAPLEIGGGALAAVFACLYGGSIVAWAAAAATYGRAAAVATAIALLLYPGYGALFHGASSDAVFAAAFALLALVVVRAVVAPSAARFAVVGLAVALAALTRPIGQVLVWLCLVPLVLRVDLRRRVVLAGTALACAITPLAAWTVHNGLRFDDYTLVRGGDASLPMYRAWVVDRIVEPENGPATRRLARLVERDLLPYEPYRSYGITIDEFFSSGAHRMLTDLVSLSDRAVGWDSDYALLGEVAREAVLAHPGAYARGVAETVLRQLWAPLYGDRRAGAGDEAPAEPAETAAPAGSSTTDLPVPTEGEPIPAARQDGWSSRPDNAISQVWTSPTEKHVVFDDPELERRAEEQEERLAALEGRFDVEPGIDILGKLADGASRVYPRPLLWLLAGLAALALRRPRRALVPLALAVSALMVIGASALAIDAVPHYAVPVIPAFVLLAVVGFLAERRRAPIAASDEVRASTAAARRPAAAPRAAGPAG